MSKKLIIVGIVSLALVLVAAGVWWLTKSQPLSIAPNGAILAPTEPVGGEPGQIVPPAPVTAIQPSSQQVAETNLKNLALRFVEIYGSYSTDSNYANLKAIEGLITASWQQSLSASLAATPPAEGFYSVTTKALIAEIGEQSEGSAVVLVTTQRQELFSRQAEPQLRYQDIRVRLVRAGNDWLVDGAEWQ